MTGQHILQLFINGNTAGTTLSSISGGTNRANNNSLTINDATVPTTFAGTAGSAWNGIGLRLNPT